MRNANHPGARDIHSAFLLFNLVFRAPSAVVLPQDLHDLPSGMVYAAPELDARSRFEDMPWQLAHAALWQVHANLLLMVDSDDPEFVHQARVGWRRLRGTLRLFRSLQGLPDMPQADAMRTVIARLRALRDVDVARLEVLPRAAMQQLAPQARGECRALIAVLDADAAQGRSVLRRLLQDAQVGEALWQQVLWLMQLREARPVAISHPHDQEMLTRWARDCVGDIHQHFERAMAKGKDEATRHRARIWAKRLRYAAEDLQGLLDSKTQKWLQQARRVQSGLGTQRDLEMAAALATQHGYGQLAPHILRMDSTPA